MAYFPPTGSLVAYQSLPSSLLTGSSIVGQLPAGTAVLGSVATLQGTNPWITTFSNSSILATPTGNQSVSGTVLVNNGSVVAFQSLPSSLLTGSSIFGQLPAGTAVLGSVATLQGTSPWVVNFQNPSILAVPVGSTIVMIQANSIAGTYAEDAGHTTADRGLFVLGVRNDLATSIASANLDYTPIATDSFARTVIKPFAPDEAIFTFQTSIVSGSVTLVRASAIGERSYITDFWLVNSGSVSTLITWRDGSTSILGYAVAPAGTGANSPGIHAPIKTNPSQDLAFTQAPSASILYVTVNGYQAP